VEAEPFRAIYSKACLDPIRQALEAGKLRMVSFLPEVKVRWVEEKEIRDFDPDLLTFKNCNTPEELEAVRALWQAQH
jgi:molybdopterin-guanine dinucleotide biosynthesis protein A